MAYDKYRINPAYLNQFRNMAYNDPWFALGELIGNAAGNAYGKRQYEKQLDKAGQIDAASAREAYYDTANKNAQASGLIGTSTYDGITQAKTDYGTHKTAYDDAMAKLNAFKGDQDSQEYKGLWEMAQQAQAGRQNANNRAEMLRQINRDNGWSNEGYYATDSLSEKLGNTSLLAPRKQEEWQGISLGEGLLSTAQTDQQASTPTITDLAQRSFNTLRQKPAGVLSKDDVARYYMTNPELKEKIVADHDRSKRSASYWSDLERKMKQEGVSQEVIDEYLGGKKRAVAEDMLGDYYKAVLDGNYLGADALATLTAGIDPQLAQILKTGGVSVGNLFGAEQSWLQSMAEAQRKEQAEARKRQQNLQDYRTKKEIDAAYKNNGSGGRGGSSSGGSKSDKLEKWEEVPHNLLTQVTMYTQNKDFESAYETVDRLKELLYRDTEALDKFPGQGLAGYRQLLAQVEYNLLEAKRSAGEAIDPAYFATVARNAGYIK